MRRFGYRCPSRARCLRHRVYASAGDLSQQRAFDAPFRRQRGTFPASLALRFLRAFLRAHSRTYTDRAAASAITQQESGVSPNYVESAWVEYTEAGIFPRDGEASADAGQALIETSSLIRELPARAHTKAEDYIDRGWLARARQSMLAQSLSTQSLPA